MTESLSRQLRRAIRETGLNAGTIARQADVSREDMAALLAGSDDAKVDALAAVGVRLGLVVRLERAQETRARSAVQSVVDVALDKENRR